ncbi:MAG: hypothetical protein V1767_08930 [Chloroflexota bacterium]
MKLREIAHSRTGDKLNIVNVSAIPYREEDYDLLRRELTVERVKKQYKGIALGKITRYELPGIKGLNFVMEEALGGGVSRSLNLDLHGKSFNMIMLDIDIQVPDDYVLPKR